MGKHSATMDAVIRIEEIEALYAFAKKQGGERFMLQLTSDGMGTSYHVESLETGAKAHITTFDHW